MGLQRVITFFDYTRAYYLNKVNLKINIYRNRNTYVLFKHI